MIVGTVSELDVDGSGVGLGGMFGGGIPDAGPGTVCSLAMTVALGVRLGLIAADASFLGRRHLCASVAGGIAGFAAAVGLIVLGVPWAAIRVLEGVFAS